MGKEHDIITVIFSSEDTGGYQADNGPSIDGNTMWHTRCGISCILNWTILYNVRFLFTELHQFHENSFEEPQKVAISTV